METRKCSIQTVCISLIQIFNPNRLWSHQAIRISEGPLQCQLPIVVLILVNFALAGSSAHWHCQGNC